ncbi:class I SAM-dependent methyltransferase [Aneurinibacillus tyrosinisolvens]|uniref:class I SAM-dependent methyltransferase n=1 Tax=Aneurinibacillus tyrosinisolvens TaxID=1443435 RepID=UPI00063EF055|nr:class I SAM-dependent methyltransferase [Aneurinibacillus tyrosinisolvens]
MEEEWFVKSFQEDYSTLYKHRDEQAARKEIASLLKALPLPQKGRVLDFCCGDGRHSRSLADHGYEVVGFDLSTYLLEQAREKSQGYPITYYCYDMREIPFENEFDIVFNLFTSFGYFSKDEENEQVALRMGQALKPGGHLILDFLNLLYTEENLVPLSTRQMEGKEIVERRKIEGGFVIKEILISENGQQRQFWERVRLYSKEEISAMLEKAQVNVKGVYGDYTLAPYSSDSKRMIIHGISSK